MPDFSQLLKKPMADAKRPPALPVGDYPGVVKSYELGDQNKNKTPYVRFHLGLTGWPDSVSEDEHSTPDGKAIDLSKKQFHRDFYLTPEADWRLAEFLRSCGVADSDFETAVPNAVGAQVLVEIQQYIGKDGEIGNQTNQVKGAA
jgi:hypothetical protein